VVSEFVIPGSVRVGVPVRALRVRVEHEKSLSSSEFLTRTSHKRRVSECPSSQCDCLEGDPMTLHALRGRGEGPPSWFSLRLPDPDPATSIPTEKT